VKFAYRQGAEDLITLLDSQRTVVRLPEYGRSEARLIILLASVDLYKASRRWLLKPPPLALTDVAGRAV